MRLTALLTTLLLLLFAVSCGSTSTSSKNDDDTLINDNDMVMTDDDSESTDETQDVLPDAVNDEDENEKSDEDEIEIPDEPFLEPNRGLAFSITANMLAEMPPQSTVSGDDMPDPLFGEFITEDGEKIPIEDRKHSYITLYQQDGRPEKYVIAFANATGTGASYAIQAIASLDTLDWMKSESVDVVSGLNFYLYIYKSWYETSELYISCPIAINTSDDNAQFYAETADKEWLTDESEHFMINSALNFDKKQLVEFFREADYVSLCQCYAGASFTQRDCKAEEIDMPPTEPVWPTPKDGSVGTLLSTTLSWEASTDPDGGSVSYSILLDTVSPPAKEVVADQSETTYAATLKKDTKYFWQVIAKDEEGNQTPSKVWFFDTTEDTATFTDHDLLIVVSPDDYTAIKTSIDTYQADNTAEGISSAVLVWQPGSAELLHDIIKQHVTDYKTKGVVLVGEMPAGWFEQTVDYGGEIGVTYEQFPIDIYLADMDGTWEDTDHNGLFDVHPDIDVEIYLSRIPGTTTQLTDYFKKDHTYRTNGSLVAKRTFFNFMDDDWNGYAEWRNQDWGLGEIYDGNYIRFEDADSTTKEKYVEQMRGDGAEYVYQWIHTSPHRIYFDDNYSPNPNNVLPIEEIRNPPVHASFYNLFNCSGSRFTEEGGTLAIAYLHSPEGLATFGSTKTGGSYQPEIFNQNLVNGGNWGTSWKLWINDTFSNGENDQAHLDSWWLGMVVLGDPLIRLADAPKTLQTRSVIKKAPLSEGQKESLQKFIREGVKYQQTTTFKQYKLRHPEFFRK